MTTKFATTALIIACGLIASSTSFAGDGGQPARNAPSYATWNKDRASDGVSDLTRQKVEAELAAAQRSGDVMGAWQLGLNQNEINPNLYPAKPVPAGLTREQVRLDLAAAENSGDILGSNELGLKRSELNPQLYPTRPVQTGFTRVQVKGELAKAIISGDYMVTGEYDGLCNELHPNMHPAL